MTRHSNRRGGVAMALGGALVLIGGVLAAGYLVRAGEATAATTATPGAEPGRARPPEAAAPEPSRAAAATVAAVREAAEAFAARQVHLDFDGRTATRAWRDLGLVVDEHAVAREAERVEASGAAPSYPAAGATVPLVIDRARAEAALAAVKAELDRGPENARLDLEERKIVPEKAGFGIEVVGALAAIEVAARTGAERLELEGAEIPPTVSRATLGIDDVSTVIGSYQTTFPVGEKSRSDNLKLVASHIDGLILQPGEVFSFNKVVGDRTEKEGYKIAHVITAGEMVDGMAGGACQISTTLHGAVWFAGLDIVDAVVHSRPSTYVPLGFDATVAWPNTDFVWKNSFDFPIAISYKVARGVARVEILGARKVYDEVAFVREVREQKPFDTITREDDAIGMGYMQIDQPGFPGYKLDRIRIAYKDGKAVKNDKWTVHYKPVVEYVRMGVNPNPNLPRPPDKKSHMPKPAQGSSFRLVQ